jgi:hypothetical protein
MKRYVRLLVAITFLFGLGVAAKAETRAEIVITLPFGFVVGGKKLPAGTYTASRWSGDNFGSLMLTSRDNRASASLLPSGIESASADKPQVSFRQDGEQYFLCTIQTSWDVYHIPYPIRSSWLPPRAQATTLLLKEAPEATRSLVACLIAAPSL